MASTHENQQDYTAEQLCLFNKVLSKETSLKGCELSYEETVAIYNLLLPILGAKALSDAEYFGIASASSYRKLLTDCVTLLTRLTVTKHFLLDLETEKVIKPGKAYVLSKTTQTRVARDYGPDIIGYQHNPAADPRALHEWLSSVIKHRIEPNYQFCPPTSKQIKALFTLNDQENLTQVLKNTHEELTKHWPTENLDFMAYLCAIRKDNKLQGAYWIYSSGRYMHTLDVPEVKSQHDLLAELQKLKN